MACTEKSSELCQIYRDGRLYFSYVEGSSTVTVGEGDMQVRGGTADPEMENLE